MSSRAEKKNAAVVAVPTAPQISLRTLANALIVVLRAALVSGARGLPFDILFSDEPKPALKSRIGNFILILGGLKVSDVAADVLFPSQHAGLSSVQLTFISSPKQTSGLSAGEYIESVLARLRGMSCLLPGLPDGVEMVLELRSIDSPLQVSYENGCDCYAIAFSAVIGPQARVDGTASTVNAKAAIAKGAMAAAPAVTPDQNTVAELAAIQTPEPA